MKRILNVWYLLNGLVILVFIQQTPCYSQTAFQNAVGHNKQGMKHMEEKQYPYAIEEFKLAIMLSPQAEVSSNYYNNLGIAYTKSGQSDLAIESIQHAIKLNPSFAKYYENLVSVYDAKNVLNEARLAYEEIIRYNENDSEATLILGLIYKQLGMPKMSMQSFEKVVSLAPGNRLKTLAEEYLSRILIKQGTPLENTSITNP